LFYNFVSAGGDWPDEPTAGIFMWSRFQNLVAEKGLRPATTPEKQNHFYWSMSINSYDNEVSG